MGTFRCEWAVTNLSMGQIRDRWKTDRAAVIGCVAPTVCIRRVGVHETGIVPTQFAVCVTDSAIPASAASASQAELDAVVEAPGLHDTRTLCTEGSGDQAVPNDDRTVQDIREPCPRIADIVAEIVGNRHILDGVYEAVSRVTRFQNPVRRDRPVGTGCEYTALYRLHVRLDSGITRVRLGGAVIDVFDETRIDAGSGSGSRASRTGRERRSDCADVERV